MVVPEFRRVVRIVCVVTALEVRVSTPLEWEFINSNHSRSANENKPLKGIEKTGNAD